eukprot:scaffold51067_cov66-Phaeocystis_antarctica.AAC.3
MSDVFAYLHVVVEEQHAQFGYVYFRETLPVPLSGPAGRTDIGKRNDIDSLREVRFDVVLVHQGVNWNLRIHIPFDRRNQLRPEPLELFVEPLVPGFVPRPKTFLSRVNCGEDALAPTKRLQRLTSAEL